LCLIHSCFYSLCVAERHDRDEEELVPLCDGEYESLKGAFMLQGGVSMRVKHIRSFSVAELQDLVKTEGGDWKLVPAWLDQNELRPLLRDFVDPVEVKKPRVALIPSGVFGEGQSKLHWFKS
jgi:hypothetical protein